MKGMCPFMCTKSLTNIPSTLDLFHAGSILRLFDPTCRNKPFVSISVSSNVMVRTNCQFLGVITIDSFYSQVVWIAYEFGLFTKHAVESLIIMTYFNLTCKSVCITHIWVPYYEIVPKSCRLILMRIFVVFLIEAENGKGLEDSSTIQI